MSLFALAQPLSLCVGWRIENKKVILNQQERQTAQRWAVRWAKESLPPIEEGDETLLCWRRRVQRILYFYLHFSTQYGQWTIIIWLNNKHGTMKSCIWNIYQCQTWPETIRIFLGHKHLLCLILYIILYSNLRTPDWSFLVIGTYIHFLSINKKSLRR